MEEQVAFPCFTKGDDEVRSRDGEARGDVEILFLARKRGELYLRQLRHDCAGIRLGVRHDTDNLLSGIARTFVCRRARHPGKRGNARLAHPAHHLRLPR